MEASHSHYSAGLGHCLLDSWTADRGQSVRDTTDFELLELRRHDQDAGSDYMLGSCCRWLVAGILHWEVARSCCSGGSGCIDSEESMACQDSGPRQLEGLALHKVPMQPVLVQD